MTLHFSLAASDTPCVCRAEFEPLLEILNGFVAIGNQLLSAYLVDDDGIRIDLPPEAFDGLPITGCLQNLTKEYNDLLGMKNRA